MIDYSKVKPIDPEVFINNRLTAKPRKAIASVTNIFKKHGAGYQLRIQQDYTGNDVYMQLEGVCSVCDLRGKSFYPVFGLSRVPITRKPEAYTKALREMLANPAAEPTMTEKGEIAVKQRNPKINEGSLLQRILKRFCGY